MRRDGTEKDRLTLTCGGQEEEREMEEKNCRDGEGKRGKEWEGA